MSRSAHLLEALELCRNAVDRNPTSIELREALIQLLLKLDKQKEVAEELTQIEKLYRSKLEGLDRGNDSDDMSTKDKSELASVLWVLNKRDEARQLYRECIKDSTWAPELNSFAMEMAQMLLPEDRDTNLAMEAAIRLNEMTSYGDSNYLDTLATVYAAQGDFEQAVKWQLKAIELNTNRGSEHIFERNLNLFREGKSLAPDDDYGRRPRCHF